MPEDRSYATELANEALRLQEKFDAALAFIAERERCKNPDMTPYRVSHAEVTAFMCGWDAKAKQQ